MKIDLKKVNFEFMKDDKNLKWISASKEKHKKMCIKAYKNKSF